MPFHHLPKLYFLHIPKAGGTSFRNWLSEYFDIGGLLPAEHLPELEKLGTEVFKDYQYFSGHFGWRLMDLAEAAGEAIMPITMLREPAGLYGSGWTYATSIAEADIERLGPELQHQVSNTKLLVAEKNSESHAYAGFTNIMVRYIAHHGTEVAEPATVTEQSLELAKQRLAAMPFFGLVEDWPRSAVLFADALRLPLRILQRRENASEQRNDDRYNSEFIRLSLADNDLDVRFHNYAQALFDERYRKVAAKFGLPKDANPDDFRAPLKQQFVERGKQIAGADRVRTASIPMSAGFVTEGFPFRYEEPDLDGWCLWTGEDLASSIFLPLDRSQGLKLRLVIKVIMSHAIRAGLNFRVDKQPAVFDLQYEMDGDGVYYNACTIDIPAIAVGSSVGYTEISMHVPGTVFAPDPEFNSGTAICLGGALTIQPMNGSRFSQWAFWKKR